MQTTELTNQYQPLDVFEIERHRHLALANSVAMAMLEGFGDTVDTREWQTDDPSFGFGRVNQPILYTSLNDRDDGKYMPIFQTHMDLQAIRAEARTITAMSGGVMGAIGTLSNYTFGAGLKITVQRAASCPTTMPEETVNAWIKEAQAIIDKFERENNFKSNMDVEIHNRTREDGEAFVELCLSPSGQIRASFDEPDMIVAPNRADQLQDWLQDEDPTRYSSEWNWSWSFGIHNIRRTPDEPMGYHVVYDLTGDDWEYIPASRMLHVKANVPRNVKRGVSDLYWIASDVMREAKIKKNTADGAALQAAIAWFREHATGVTPAAVNALQASGTVATRQQRTSTGTKPTKQGTLRSGSVVDIPETMKVLPGPMGSERNANFILIAQYVARAIASRWAMPEFMFTSDASNSNYASTLIAESPFVKAREFDQRFYGQHFISLMWKVLRLAHEIGRAFGGVNRFDVLMDCLEITAEGPRVSTHDEMQAIQADKILLDAGAMSLDTLSARHNLDRQKEQAKGAVAQGGAPPQMDAAGNVIPPPPEPGGEYINRTLQQIRRARKGRSEILSDFRAGKSSEAEARQDLGALGFSSSNIDALLDSDQSNDPPPDPTTEGFEESDIAVGSKPDSELADVPTQDEFVRDAQAKMQYLIDQLGVAVVHGDENAQREIRKKIEMLKASTLAAAGVLGIVAVFKGSVLHAPPGNKPPPAKSVVIAGNP